MGEKKPKQSDGNGEQGSNTDGQAEHPAQAIAKNLIRDIRERDADRPQVAPPEPAPKPRKWFGRSSVVASIGLLGVASMTTFTHPETTASESPERTYVTRDMLTTEAHAERIEEAAEPDNIPLVPLSTVGVAVNYEIAS